MSLFKARIFRNSLFKQFKFFFSAPEKSFRYLLISETGEVGTGLLPMITGFLVSHDTQRVWRMVSDLTCLVKGMEGRMLPISEREYLPLDPHGKLGEEAKKYSTISTLEIDKDGTKTVKLSELDSISSREHDKAQAILRNSSAKREAAAMFKTAMIVCGIILVLIVIWSMVKK